MTYQERIQWFEAKGYRVDLLRKPRAPNESVVVQVQRPGHTQLMMFTITKRGDYTLMPPVGK